MRSLKWLLGLIPLALVGLVVVLSLRPGVYLPVHRHCMHVAALELRTYALSHGDRFPQHPKGYGNALLLLREDSWPYLTGPGYDVAVFQDAKAAGKELPEELCGRVYVQGLTTDCDARLVVLFDKLATPGGDHCHFPVRLWAPRGREALHVDGHIEFVSDENWSAFAEEQINLLVREGIPRAEAERLYAQIVR